MIALPGYLSHHSDQPTTVIPTNPPPSFRPTPHCHSEPCEESKILTTLNAPRIKTDPQENNPKLCVLRALCGESFYARTASSDPRGRPSLPLHCHSEPCEESKILTTLNAPRIKTDPQKNNPKLCVLRALCGESHYARTASSARF